MADAREPVQKPVRELQAEDITALGQLLAGMVRAGLPLESGLRAVGSGWPGRAGEAIRLLTERLNQGQSLEHAISDLSSTVPGEFSALIQAGQRSGRLPEMLDDLTRLARMRQETRRLAVVSLIYPLIVALVAVLLGLFIFTHILPVMLDLMIDFRVGVPDWLYSLGTISRRVAAPLTSEVWVGLIAGGLLFIAFATFRLGHFAEKHAERVPFLGRAWRDSRLAYWADVIALLLEHGTPEAEAVELAARMAGQKKMIEQMGALTAMMRAGQQPTVEDWHKAGVPVLGAWAVTWRGPAGDRVSTLRLMARTYERQARDRMILSYNLLPVLALVGVGGVFTLVYGLMLFLPLTTLYRSLS